MHLALIILLILVEILAVSWILFFIIKLNKIIIKLNADILVFKKNMMNAFIETRLSLRILEQQIKAIKKRQERKQFNNTLKTIANFSFFTYFLKKKK